MRFSELREKEVINCRDCERLGFPCDLAFDVRTGCLEALIVPVFSAMTRNISFPSNASVRSAAILSWWISARRIV